VELFWLIPLLPFAGALINGVFGRRLGMNGAAAVGMATVLGSFVLALIAFLGIVSLPAGERVVETSLFTWFAVGGLNIDIGFLLDPLSAVMILFVTGVGFLIHVYSRGYMAEDPSAWRFFCYLHLFMGSMLTLVLGRNLPIMFLGWEGVGLCSYLLIGFWYERKAAADAGKKAFIVNRIGDFGVLLGTFLLFTHLGTLNFVEISQLAPTMLVAGGAAVTAICLLLFLGATGKSAQIPLYVWLPDAMEGPTPVSALIHAATMVTAGVYMLARLSVVFVLAPTALYWVAVIGCLTALFAATIGTSQDNIKRVLAYSTISQLGYMFLACGVGAFAAGIFHVMTHAFFKALLFLGAGAVIHALHDEQNMWKMGGLRKHLNVTHVTFLIACLAIAGLPPFAGFFSKDEILWKTFSSGRIGLYVLGLLTAGLTAFYMFRLLLVTFYGKTRVSAETLGHLHKPSNWMRVPLMVLAFFSIVGGLVGIPILEGGNKIVPFLEEVVASPADIAGSASSGGHASWFVADAFAEDDAADTHGAATDADTHGDAHGSPATGAAGQGDGHGAPGDDAHGEHNVGLELGLMALSVLVALAGIFLAFTMYIRSPGSAKSLRDSALGQLVANKYGIDELNDRFWVRPIGRFSDFLWRDFDVLGIDGVVNGTARLFGSISSGLSRVQNGQAQTYLFSVLAGMAGLLFYWILR
jgi:NADH-quinone oxidoreductase subunit L